MTQTPFTQEPYQVPGNSFQPAPQLVEQRKAGFFDVGFTKFLSLTFVSALWVIALVGTALAVLIALIYGVYSINQNNNLGFLYVVGSVVAGALFLVLIRLSLEGVAILFRIGNNTSEIARNSRH